MKRRRIGDAMGQHSGRDRPVHILLTIVKKNDLVRRATKFAGDTREDFTVRLVKSQFVGRKMPIERVAQLIGLQNGRPMNLVGIAETREPVPLAQLREQFQRGG